jgi:hypothetical protein
MRGDARDGEQTAVRLVYPAMPRTAPSMLPDGFDPRLVAWRPDLADIALRGLPGLPVAAHYAEAEGQWCVTKSTPMLHEPGGEQGSELLHGEKFMALFRDAKDDPEWLWGWSEHDHYVGYVHFEWFVDGPPLDPLPVVTGDPVDIARTFLGMPYVWGGRGAAGIDCSGLIQRSMAAAGIAAQRDSDMQAKTLGRLLSDDEPHQRGDILFFPGHVGIVSAPDTMIHATRAFGCTVEEPLAEAVARIAKKNDGVAIVARRRVALFESSVTE